MEAVLEDQQDYELASKKERGRLESEKKRRESAAATLDKRYGSHGT